MRFNNLVACGRNTLICIKHTPSGGEFANNAEMDATQILDAYIKLHTDYSGYVVDTSWLPADKAKMKQVLQQYWLQTTSAQIRKWLEDGWVFLAWFQDGVGPIPIDISSKVRSNAIRSLVEPQADASYGELASIGHSRWRPHASPKC